MFEYAGNRAKEPFWAFLPAEQDTPTPPVMRMDIEEHELVPNHEVVDDDTVDELLEEHGIDKEQLPVIDRTDAVVKQLEAEVGDVIRIDRESPTAGETTYYRRVVEL